MIKETQRKYIGNLFSWHCELCKAYAAKSLILLVQNLPLPRGDSICWLPRRSQWICHWEKKKLHSRKKVENLDTKWYNDQSKNKSSLPQQWLACLLAKTYSNDAFAEEQ